MLIFKIIITISLLDGIIGIGIITYGTIKQDEYWSNIGFIMGLIALVCIGILGLIICIILLWTS